MKRTISLFVFLFAYSVMAENITLVCQNPNSSYDLVAIVNNENNLAMLISVSDDEYRMHNQGVLKAEENYLAINYRPVETDWNDPKNADTCYTHESGWSFYAKHENNVWTAKYQIYPIVWQNPNKPECANPMMPLFPPPVSMACERI